MQRTREQVNQIEELTRTYISVFNPAYRVAADRFEGQFERDERARAVAHNVAVLWIEEQQRRRVSL